MIQQGVINFKQANIKRNCWIKPRSWAIRKSH